MSKLKVTLNMHSSLKQDATAIENIVNEIIGCIEAIVEVTGCHMEWGNPTAESVNWEFSFKNEQQEEVTLSMLNLVLIDYPEHLMVETV
jgi:hypothetical protein